MGTQPPDFIDQPSAEDPADAALAPDERNRGLEAGDSSAVDDARTLLLSLALSLRSIGRSTSVDRMDELEREYPAAEEALSGLAEVLPRQVGRMLSDLVLEASPDGRERRELSAKVFDPRSFREAADAVELVADTAPDEVLLAYASLPMDRWPADQIQDAGLFLLGLVLRGIPSVKAENGRLCVADASIDVLGLREARRTALDWHRAFATAAARSSAAGRELPGPGELRLASRGLPVVFGEVRETRLGKELLLSEEQAGLLSSLVHLLPGDAPDDLLFRRRVAASLHLFLRLLQRPYAVVFQDHLAFAPTGGPTHFRPPSTVLVGQDGDLWQVASALSSALDAALGVGGLPASASGPVMAFGEAVSAGTGRSPTEGFCSFTVAYLAVLCVQQGIVDRRDAPESWVDRRTVGRMHAQFLEILLEEQRKALFREGKRIGEERMRGLVDGGAGALALPFLAWAMPRAYR